MEQQHVVIAGAGPVGLWLAGELRLGGVAVTVVEERTEIDQLSKALTVHPRTIEILATRGLHEQFVAEDLRIPSGHFGALEKRLDFSGLDTPFPFTLALPQARTEEILEERGHSRMGPSRTGPSRTAPSQTGPARTGPSRTALPPTAPSRTALPPTAPPPTAPPPTARHPRSPSIAPPSTPSTPSIRPAPPGPASVPP